MRPNKIKLVVLFTLLLLGAWNIAAQDELVLDEGITEISVQADAPTRATIMGKAGDVVMIKAIGDETIDTTLTLLNDQDEKIAYGDDHLVNGQIVRDAHLTIRWREDATFTLLVDIFNGVSEGEITLELERFDTELQLTPNGTIQATLFAGDNVRVLYEAETAENVIISVRDISSTLDPIVRVMDANGQVLAVGDDKPNLTNGLNTLDTHLMVELPKAGVYTLEIIDFLGRAGEVKITVSAVP